MGYSHHWRRKEKLNSEGFKKAVLDFRKLLPILARTGVKLGDGEGSGEPELYDNYICFNGLEECGHPRRFNLIIPWPTNHAGGVAWNSEQTITGKWLGGALLEKRTCDGNCAYETFFIQRDVDIKARMMFRDRHGWFLKSCKTNFKPYDLAVTACLVILKHHLPSEIEITSNGHEAHWWDAKFICQSELGYGLDFQFD